MTRNNRCGLALQFKETQIEIIFETAYSDTQFAIETESELRQELYRLVLMQPDRIRAASLLNRKRKHTNTV
jgi:hypothetical protein